MCPETHFFHVHNEQDYVLHLSKEVAASLSLLSLFWLVCLTALWLISWSTTVDSSHEGFLGQGLLAAAWFVAGFSSIFLRRDAIAAGFFFVICFLSPISLFPRGNSFLELYELHAAGQKFDTNESANLEEKFSAPAACRRSFYSQPVSFPYDFTGIGLCLSALQHPSFSVPSD
ncbi:unnamed protein product [Effrenium voratum]|nr:unnamed protein product [Effrenium voratum]